MNRVKRILFGLLITAVIAAFSNVAVTPEVVTTRGVEKVHPYHVQWIENRSGKVCLFISFAIVKRI